MVQVPSPSSGRRGTRTPFVHVTWQRHGGRAEEMAHAMGGRAVQVYPRWLAARRWVLLRYVISALITLAALVRYRPLAVAVTNPPVVPGLVVTAWGAVTRTPFLLDSHTGSFGVKGNVAARRLLGVHRFMARRAAAVMVTTTSWVQEVERWGARGIVVHEAPPPWSVSVTPPEHERPRVLFVGVYSKDEPVEELVAAAAELPDCDVAVTGDLDRCPPGLRESAPANVTFVGFLDADAYRRQVEDSDVLVTLTTEPTSVMRSSYEAVYARRGLVLSDWPVLREVFPLGRAAHNTAADLARAVREELDQAPSERMDRAERAREIQLERWRDQVASMHQALAAKGAGLPGRAP